MFDAVLLGRKPHMGINPSEEDLSIVATLLGDMGLKDLALRHIDELSGGEFQKVMLARALAQKPCVLLLDEPTSNLDLRNQYETLALIRKIALRDGIAVILIIHDLNLALRYCDRFILLREGTVYASGGVEIITPEAIRSVYGIDAEIIVARGVPLVLPLPDQGSA